ncbi:pirin family protein, partial [Serratia sp. Se-PFBMAAmG]|nr:pirin family protein [Serratia sp. Se-PFBMAAmG]
SDALAIWDESALTINADSDAEILLFDLPPV